MGETQQSERLPKDTQRVNFRSPNGTAGTSAPPSPRRQLPRPGQPHPCAPSLVRLREPCDLAGKFTKCCSFVWAVMGTPLTTTLHLPCGVIVTLPSKFVKEACLSEILKRQEFV